MYISVLSLYLSFLFVDSLFFSFFLPFPSLFRFESYFLLVCAGYPPRSASISRDGARRALIGAARMAEQSREPAQPFTISPDALWLLL